MYAIKNNYKFINRKTSLAKDKANGNDLLNHHSNLIESDLYFQLFVTAPLLKVKSINEIKKQFEALGLKPEMITAFISQAKSYLDTEQGQQAKDLLMQGLSAFSNP